MPPDPLDFRTLKRTVTIEQVLRSRGVFASMRRRGHRIVGPCPVHGGDNPTAFVVVPRRQLWYCFTQCCAGGDVVELVRRLDGTGYRATAIELARLAGMAPLVEHVVPNARTPTRPFRAFSRRLPLDAAAPFLAAKGIRRDTAAAFEAGKWHGRGFLQGCIAVRLHDSGGRPLGYAGRRIKPDAARRYGKWKVPPGLPKAEILFNHHRARPLHEGVIVVECPWGVMRLAQLGFPAVALMGTSMSRAQREILITAKRVVLMLDGDAAGHSAARRIRDSLATEVSTATWRLPDGLDPDDVPDRLLGPWASSFLACDLSADGEPDHSHRLP